MPDETPEQPQPTPDPQGPVQFNVPPQLLAGTSSMPAPESPPDETETTTAVIEQLEKLRRSRVLVYWTSQMGCGREATADSATWRVRTRVTAR
jgi:hypothetical protein